MLEALGELHHLTNFLRVSSHTASAETSEGKREPFKAFLKGSGTPSATGWKRGAANKRASQDSKGGKDSWRAWGGVCKEHMNKDIIPTLLIIELHQILPRRKEQSAHFQQPQNRRRGYWQNPFILRSN